MTRERSAETLTRLESRFVKEYALDFNGTEAYLRASNSTNRKSASVQAVKLLKKPKVAKALDVYIEESIGPHQKRLAENVKYWESVRDNPEERTADRMKASENLAKYSQMFSPESAKSSQAPVQIVDDIG